MSDVTTSFNQRKPPHRTICVAVDLTAEFDTVNHNVLLSKIARLSLPEATCRWLSNYIRGRQSVTRCSGVKSKARIIHTGVREGSKLSPTLFSFYIIDIPWPTEPVRRISYADDITVLASGVKKRLKQSDSSSCPDCGMDPQDVPHLFDCTAHPDDLSPVNLWDKPVETIRELSFLDQGNLD